MAYQRAFVPMLDIAVSQSYGEGISPDNQHYYSYSLDLSGKDKEASYVYAPFDCKVAQVYCPKGHSYEVWLHSTKKVLCPNGYYGYLTLTITHPTEIKNMKVGQKFKQNQLICREGKEGGATGFHIHIEVSTGHVTGWKTIKNQYGTFYMNKNAVPPQEYLFARENSVIYNSKYKGHPIKFIKESDITKKVCDIPSEPLLIHKTPDYKSSSVIKNKGLRNNEEVIEFYKQGTMSYIYHYETMGFVCSKYLK